MIEIRPPEQVARRAYQRAYDAARTGSRRGTQYLDKLKLVDDLKDNACVDCGGSFPPECMDFDHRDPATKTRGVAPLTWGAYSMRRILEEVAKCDLVCANCHRIRTWRTA